MNPFGAVATLIVGVAGALYLYSKRMSEANKRKRELNEINLEAEKSIGEEKKQTGSFT